MIWTNKCPGIDATDYEGFHITRIDKGEKRTNRIDSKGNAVYEKEYAYVAAKPGPPKPTLYKGVDIDKIIARINRDKQLSLF